MRSQGCKILLHLIEERMDDVEDSHPLRRIVVGDKRNCSLTPSDSTVYFLHGHHPNISFSFQDVTLLMETIYTLPCDLLHSIFF